MAMSRDEVFQKVQEVLVDALGVDEDEVTADATLMGDLGAEMLYEAVKGSKLMDLVPRPAGIKPGLGWLVSQAVQLFWRNVGKQRIYVSVRDVVAGRYRAAFIVACAEAA